MFRNAIIIAIVTITIGLFTTSAFAQLGGSMTGSLLGVPVQGSQAPSTGNGGGRKIYDGAYAAEIRNFINYGSRYLMLMSTTYDPNTRCNIEIRAWVRKIEANDGYQTSVSYDEPFSVQNCGNRPTVTQVNNTEAQVATARKWIAELQTNPGKYANAAGWINSYTNYINQANTWVAQVNR